MSELYRKAQSLINRDRFQQSAADAGHLLPGNVLEGHVYLTAQGQWYFDYLCRDCVQNDDQVSRVEGLISPEEALKLLQQGIPLLQAADRR